MPSDVNLVPGDGKCSSSRSQTLRRATRGRVASIVAMRRPLVASHRCDALHGNVTHVTPTSHERISEVGVFAPNRYLHPGDVSLLGAYRLSRFLQTVPLGLGEFALDDLFTATR